MKPVLLLDVDGVLANFTGAYLDLLAELTGHLVEESEVTNWHLHENEFFKTAAAKADIHPRTLKERIDDRVTNDEGFCRGLKPYPQAARAVASLQEVARVYCVTAPWHSSSHWHHQRTSWLVRHMNVRRENVVHASDKTVVHGDFLVDDKPANLEHWRHGRPVLWDQPYNQGALKAHWHLATNWETVQALVEEWRPR